MKGTSFGILLLAFAATGASTRVLGADVPGFYLGAAIGESHVRSSKEILGDTDYDSKFDERHSGWKITAGIRPSSPLGIELEYIDFGNPSADLTDAGFGGISRADAKALALFGVGYLPLSVPPAPPPVLRPPSIFPNRAPMSRTAPGSKANSDPYLFAQSMSALQPAAGIRTFFHWASTGRSEPAKRLRCTQRIRGMSLPARALCAVPLPAKMQNTWETKEL
jgi:hypothetical protein